MIDAITTNETRFFREPRQFEFLMQKVFPRWRADAEQRSRSKRVRIWSAGCSSGEEPYTLSMLLEQASSIGGRLGRADSSHGHFESRAGKGVQGNLSHGEVGRITAGLIAQFYAARNGEIVTVR